MVQDAPINWVTSPLKSQFWEPLNSFNGDNDDVERQRRRKRGRKGRAGEQTGLTKTCLLGPAHRRSSWIPMIIVRSGSPVDQLSGVKDSHPLIEFCRAWSVGSWQLSKQRPVSHSSLYQVSLLVATHMRNQSNMKHSCSKCALRPEIRHHPSYSAGKFLTIKPNKTKIFHKIFHINVALNLKSELLKLSRAPSHLLIIHNYHLAGDALASCGSPPSQPTTKIYSFLSLSSPTGSPCLGSSVKKHEDVTLLKRIQRHSV